MAFVSRARSHDNPSMAGSVFQGVDVQSTLVFAKLNMIIFMIQTEHKGYLRSFSRS